MQISWYGDVDGSYISCTKLRNVLHFIYNIIINVIGPVFMYVVNCS